MKRKNCSKYTHSRTVVLCCANKLDFEIATSFMDYKVVTEYFVVLNKIIELLKGNCYVCFSFFSSQNYE